MSEELHSCGTCANLLKATESWEMPHIYWWECLAIPSRANLRSFPFQNTKCGAWSKDAPIFHALPKEIL